MNSTCGRPPNTRASGPSLPPWADPGGPLFSIAALLAASARDPGGSSAYEAAFRRWHAAGAGRGVPSPHDAFCLQTALTIVSRWFLCPPDATENDRSAAHAGSAPVRPPHSGPTGARSAPPPAPGSDAAAMLSRLARAADRWPLAYTPSVYDWWHRLPPGTLDDLARLLPLPGEGAPTPLEPGPGDGDGAKGAAAIEGADVVGRAYRALFPPVTRQALGEFYTPSPLAWAIIDELEPERHVGSDGPLLLDPACGSGVFLAAACCRIARRWGEGTAVHLVETGRIAGIDVHPMACVAARVRLNILLPRWNRLRTGAPFPGALWGDALLTPAPDTPGPEEPDTPDGDSPWDDGGALARLRLQGPFRYVVGNPPFVRAARVPPHYRDQVRRRLATAQGAWDMAVPFIEQAVRWAAPEGDVRLIVTDKVASADYGRALRKWLDRAAPGWRLMELPPASLEGPQAEPLFERSLIDPVILTARRARAFTFAPPVRTSECGTRPRTHDGEVRDLLTRMEADAVPLASVGTLRGGLVGFAYYAGVELLRDGEGPGPPEPGHVPVVGAGQVLSYWAAWRKPIRLLGRWRHSLIVAAEDDGRGPFSRDAMGFFRRPKLLLRGIAPRLTAAWDPRGLGLLVAVFGLAPRSPDADPFVLTALLNSPLLDFYARCRLSRGRIPRGSWRFPKSLLGDLPIPAAVVGAGEPGGLVEDGPEKAWSGRKDGTGEHGAVDELRRAARKAHRDPFAPWNRDDGAGAGAGSRGEPVDRRLVEAAGALYGLDADGVTALLGARRRLGFD